MEITGIESIVTAKDTKKILTIKKLKDKPSFLLNLNVSSGYLFI